MHGQAVEDRGGQGGIAEVAAPVAEGDVRGDGGGGVAMTAVDEVVERMRGGRLVVAALDLAEADVVDEQELGAGPALEAVERSPRSSRCCRRRAATGSSPAWSSRSTQRA